MDKYVLIKQSFYTTYDVIRFDIITLDKGINELIYLDDRERIKLIELLDKLCDSIFDKNIKEIIIIMKSLVINDNNYTSMKVISNLEIIKKSILKKRKLYEKYENYIYNLEKYL